MMKTKDFSLRSSYFIGENKRKWQLFFVIASLLIGIAWLPTIHVKADVVVQGLTLTAEEYSDLLASIPEGYQIVSNEEYDKLSMQRATTGFIKNAHVQNKGWMGSTTSNLIGTTGQSLRLEAVQLSLINLGTSISYEVHVQNLGWQPKVSNGGIAGTVGRGLRMEAIQISTSGKYYVTYRGHVEGLGWEHYWHTSIADRSPMQSFSGTTGSSRRLEALELVYTKRT